MGKGKFTQELFDKICNEISESERGLNHICRENGIAPVSFYDWVGNNDELANKYARARELQAEFMAEQIIAIADENAGVLPTTGGTDSGKVAQNRLRVDARKWIASKLLPKKYGEKIDLTTGGEKISLKIGYGDTAED
jgi:hypothetical protein